MFFLTCFDISENSYKRKRQKSAINLPPNRFFFVNHLLLLLQTYYKDRNSSTPSPTIRIILINY